MSHHPDDSRYDSSLRVVKLITTFLMINQINVSVICVCIDLLLKTYSLLLLLKTNVQKLCCDVQERCERSKHTNESLLQEQHAHKRNTNTDATSVVTIRNESCGNMNTITIEIMKAASAV